MGEIALDFLPIACGKYAVKDKKLCNFSLGCFAEISIGPKGNFTWFVAGVISTVSIGGGLHKVHPGVSLIGVIHGNGVQMPVSICIVSSTPIKPAIKEKSIDSSTPVTNQPVIIFACD